MTYKPTAADSLHTLIHENADGMLVVDAQGAVQFINPAAEAFLGRTAEELLEQQFGFPVAAGAKVEVDVQSHTQNPRVAELRTVQIVWNDQPAFLISLRDITERKALETDLQDRTEALEAAVGELEIFSYMISHDLWDQMRRIGQVNQALLTGEQLSDRGQDQAQQIQAISQQTRATIEGLIQFSNISHMGMTSTGLQIFDLVQDLIGQLQLVHGYRSVTLPKSTKTKIYGDQRLLRIALEHLLDNAWKYTQTCENPHVEFGQIQPDQWPSHMPAAAQQKDFGLFYIQDNGMGFNMADVDDLFRPLRQLPQSLSGQGLGLTTVQRIIHRHRGHIWAQSQRDEGATFYFTLPLQPLKDWKS